MQINVNELHPSYGLLNCDNGVLMLQNTALKNIECADRNFANECFSGTSVYNINELFAAISDMKTGCNFEKIAKVLTIAEDAENSWNFIKRGLKEINDNSRINNEFNQLRN